MRNTLVIRPRFFILFIGVALIPPCLIFIRDYWIQEPGCGLDDAIHSFFITLLFSFTVTTSLFYGNVSIFNFLQVRMPWDRAPLKRIAIEAPAVIGFTSLAMAILTWLFINFVPDLTVSPKQLFFENILIANAISLVIVLIFEGIFLFRNWRESALHAEKLQKEKLQSQYESLKAQLNPHFLFNSLNALLTLVREDASRSEEFIIRLSRVYRYVLEHKDTYAVPLAEELTFAESFLFLHQIRFGKNLQMTVQISEEKKALYVPPLTLQLLLENAVKHNVISSEKPLHISVSINEAGELEVSNNLQERLDREKSTGVGHQNLRKNYELLSDKQPWFGVRGGEYVSVIPLMEA